MENNLNANKKSIVGYASMKAYFGKSGIIMEKTYKSNDGEEITNKYLAVSVSNATPFPEKNEEGFNVRYSFFLNIPITQNNENLLLSITGKDAEDLYNLENKEKVSILLNNERKLPYILENIQLKPYKFFNKESGRYDIDIQANAFYRTRVMFVDSICSLDVLPRQEIKEEEDYVSLKVSTDKDRRIDENGIYQDTIYTLKVSKENNFFSYLLNYSMAPVEQRKSFEIFYYPERQNFLDKINREIVYSKNDKFNISYTSSSLANKIESLKSAFAKQESLVFDPYANTKKNEVTKTSSIVQEAKKKAEEITEKPKTIKINHNKTK